MKIGRLYPILLILSISLIVVTFVTLLRSFSANPVSVAALAQPKQDQPIATTTIQEIARPTNSEVKPTPSYDPTFPPTPADTPIPADATPTPNATLHPELFPTSSFAPEMGEADMSMFEPTARANAEATYRAWPTATALPTLSPDNHAKFASQNLQFTIVHPPSAASLGERLGGYGGIPAWSPDGSRFVASIAKNPNVKTDWPELSLVIFDAEGNELRELSGAHGFFSAWAPSNKLIAYQNWVEAKNEGYVQVVDVDTGKVTPVTTIHKSDVTPIFHWISDTELLFFNKEAGGVVVFDYVTATLYPLLDGATAHLIGADDLENPMKRNTSLPEQGLIALTSGQRGAIVRRNANDTIEVLRLLEGVGSDAYAFSPDGTLFAYGASSTSTLKIVTVNGKDDMVSMPPVDGLPTIVSWAPDSSSLLYVDADGVHLVNRDGSGLRLLENIPGQPSSIKWSSTGNISILYLEGEPALLRLAIIVPSFN